VKPRYVYIICDGYQPGPIFSSRQKAINFLRQGSYAPNEGGKMCRDGYLQSKDGFPYIQQKIVR
jgi:hypothetical protein